MTYYQFRTELKKAIVFNDIEYANLLLDSYINNRLFHALGTFYTYHIKLNMSTAMLELLCTFCTDKTQKDMLIPFAVDHFVPGTQAHTLHLSSYR